LAGRYSGRVVWLSIREPTRSLGRAAPAGLAALTEAPGDALRVDCEPGEGRGTHHLGFALLFRPAQARSKPREVLAQRAHEGANLLREHIAELPEYRSDFSVDPLEVRAQALEGGRMAGGAGFEAPANPLEVFGDPRKRGRAAGHGASFQGRAQKPGARACRRLGRSRLGAPEALCQGGASCPARGGFGLFTNIELKGLEGRVGV